jgi:TPR repeat protein
MEWYTKGAEAGLPQAMFNLATSLDKGQGVAAPDYPAAANWYRRAADAGDEDAPVNLAHN